MTTSCKRFDVLAVVDFPLPSSLKSKCRKRCCRHQQQQLSDGELMTNVKKVPLSRTAAETAMEALDFERTGPLDRDNITLL